MAGVPEKRTDMFGIPIKWAFFVESFFQDFTYFFRREGREKDWERNINVWLPLMHPLPGT